MLLYFRKVSKNMDSDGSSAKTMTPIEVMAYSESLISRRFPRRVAKIHEYGGKEGVWIPAYEWEGAGSEKGGSSGHLFFRKVIFADSETINKDSCLAISFGYESGGIDSSRIAVLMNDSSVSLPYIPGMAGVFREIVPRDFADRIILESRLGREEGLDEEVNYWQSRVRKVSSALRELLRSGNRTYSDISLFAFDGEAGGLRGFFAKQYAPFDYPLRDVLRPFDFEEFSMLRWKNPEREAGIRLSNNLADHLLSFGGFTISDSLDYLRSATQKRVLEHLED